MLKSSNLLRKTGTGCGGLCHYNWGNSDRHEHQRGRKVLTQARAWISNTERKTIHQSILTAVQRQRRVRCQGLLGRLHQETDKPVFSLNHKEKNLLEESISLGKHAMLGVMKYSAGS